MLCARWLRPSVADEQKKTNLIQRFGLRVAAGYQLSLAWTLNYQRWMLLGLLLTIGASVWLFVAVPKTFMPQQDTGQLRGMIRGDDGLSYHTMWPKMEQYRQALLKDKDVQSVAGFISGGSNAFLIVRLNPVAEREGAQDVVNRLRKEIPKI